ncbi:MAG: PQQ-binding-like beta-propeller repeat protein, partial [Burkholderiales bacterium]|nr:PQQ-binding-like beta-propeller repeat protein [Burkholderiales bacterium]
MAPRRAALALLSAAAVLAGCAGGTPRPVPEALPPNADLIGVRQAWQARVGAIDFPLQVSVQANRVVVASGDGTVVTLDARNGAEIARASAREPLSAGVGSDGRIAAVVTRANQVVAFEGGRELWRHRLATQTYTAPLVAGGRVFVLGADRSLVALDGASGSQLWVLQRPAEPLVLRQAGVLVAVGNTLVAGMSGRLVGVDPDAGRILWE